MIKLVNVSKLFYRGRRELKALDNINIELPNKGMTFIVGENGAGKSTLASIIAGLDKPTTGEVYYNEINYNKLDMSLFRSNTISFVFQEVNLLEDFNVYDNLKIALKLSGKDVTNEEIDVVLKKLEIENLGYRFKHELSIGQMQRVAIARAILKDAQILICDEGTSALDSQNATQVYEILKEISKDRLVIVITHDINLVYQYSENVIYLKKGRVENGVNIHSEVKIKEEIRKPKSIFKYGYKLFLKRKKSLIISSILATISLFFLAVILNLSQFDEKKYILKNINRLDITYVRVHSTLGIDEKYLIETYEVNDSTNYSLPKIDNQYYKFNINGFVYVTKDKFDRLKLKMMEGSLPNEDQNNYVAITDYMYYQYHDLGFKDIEGNIIKINSMKDLLNKKVKFNNNEYLISGIVNTGFNWGRYAFLKDIHGPAFERHEMQLLNISTFMNYVFVNENTVNNMKKNIYRTFLLTDDKKVLKSALDVKLQDGYNIESIVDCGLYKIVKVNKAISKYIKYALIFVFIFNILILFLLVNENISVRNNDIALLKSLGANNIEIFKMFYFETLLLSIFLSIVSYFVMFPLNYLLNSIFLEQKKPLLLVFDLTYYEIIIFLIFLVVVSFVSTILGVLKNRNKYMPLSLFKK